MAVTKQDRQEEVKGSIERIRYFENSFLIALLDNGLTVKGSMLDPQHGIQYTFQGRRNDHPKFGPQFDFTGYQANLPVSKGAVLYYIANNAKWIGPSIANALYEVYGKDTLSMLKDHPETVSQEIKGFSYEHAQEASAMLKANEANERSIMELREIIGDAKVSQSQITKMIEHWRHEAPSYVRKYPYQLPEVIKGIGFHTADEIAYRLGYDRDGKPRIEAGLLHCLAEAQRDGHICLPINQLTGNAYDLLGVDRDLIERVIQIMAKGKDKEQRKLVIDNDYVYTLKAYEDEIYIANKVKILLQALSETYAIGITDNDKIDELFDDQNEAIQKVSESNVFILTGSPGTGKSYTIKKIMELYRNHPIALCAPTGKASKRMFELTGRESKTVHSLLEPLPVQGGNMQFMRSENNPLDARVIIVDEVSMMDNWLMASLLRAIRPGSRLILVGDTNQLPAVGAGNVLQELIDSERVPFVELTEIKRQDPGLIIQNCHKVKDGITELEFEDGKSLDFLFIEASEQQQISGIIEDIMEGTKDANMSLLKGAWGKHVNALGKLDVLRDIQVISPLREKTDLSVKVLNNELQKLLNKNARFVQKDQKRYQFFVGDKVIQKKNEYDLGIINGDIGFIREVDFTRKEIVVQFENPEREVNVPLKDNNLELAYAITCVTPETYIWTQDGLTQVENVITNFPEKVVRYKSPKAIGTRDGLKGLTHFIRQGKKKVVKITTVAGYELSATGDHKILTVNKHNTNEEWKKIEQIEDGDYVVIPRGNYFGLNDECLSTKNFFPNFSKNRNPCSIPLLIDENIAEVLGALVADGCYTDKVDARVELAKNEEWCNHIKESIEANFNIVCRYNKNFRFNVDRFYFHNKAVREFLFWCGLDYVGSHEKDVPKIIKKSPTRVQAAFLRGLFTGDGSSGENRVVLVTTSLNLAKQVHLMLLNMDIVSKLTKGKAYTKNRKIPWRIEIYGNDIVKFSYQIGFGIKYKQKRLIENCNKLSSSGKTNWDVLPGGHYHANKIREELKSRDGRNYKANKEAILLLGRLIRKQTRLNYNHVKCLIDGIEDFDTLPSADIWMSWLVRHHFYDKVVSIADDGYSEVYDFTVSSVEHSYITNGLVSHNCHSFQGSEAPVIIIPIHPAFGGLIMQRNWLYTAISRAKKLCVMVGHKEEVGKIIARNRQQFRYTQLASKINPEIEEW